MTNYHPNHPSRYAKAVEALRAAGKQVAFVPLALGGTGEMLSSQVKKLCSEVALLLQKRGADGSAGASGRVAHVARLKKWRAQLGARFMAAAVKNSFAIYLLRKTMTRISWVAGPSGRRTCVCQPNMEAINAPT